MILMFLNILSNYYHNCPDIISLNEQLININDSDCRIINISSKENNETKINTIKLIWNEITTSFKSMFQDLKNIVDVDLSYFRDVYYHSKNKHGKVLRK